MVRLFNLRKAIRYKKKKGRSWKACREGLSSYLSNLGQLSDPRLETETPLVISEERGRGLKRIEDEADAVMCAYIAALAWLYGTPRVEMVGDLQSGYVAVPLSCREGTVMLA
jgi:predicted RNase H-like nuclease